MAYSNSSFVESFRQINILTAAALMVFTITGLVLTGLAGEVISYLETYKFLPLAATLGSMAIIFASSGTRDARYYHPIEWAVVVLMLAVVIGQAFLTEVDDVITGTSPWGAIVVMALMAVAAAILAR